VIIENENEKELFYIPDILKANLLVNWVVFKFYCTLYVKHE